MSIANMSETFGFPDARHVRNSFITQSSKKTRDFWTLSSVFWSSVDDKKLSSLVTTVHLSPLISSILLVEIISHQLPLLQSSSN